MTDTSGEQPDDAELRGEVERLRAERDDLTRKLDRSDDIAKRGGRLRRTSVVIFVVLSYLCLAAGIPGFWARNVVLDTDRYVEIVGPIGTDPAVGSFLAERLTDELFTALNAQQVVAEALPDRAKFLAGPLTTAVQGFVRDEVEKILASDQFARLWVETNRFAQTQIEALLRAEGGASVTTQNGRVVLNLIPVINAALIRIQAQASELVGSNVTLPQLDPDTQLPAEMRTQVEAALGVQLPDDFGQIVIFDDDRLQAAQDALVSFERLLYLLVSVYVLSIAGAIALSKQRRRTIVQLSAGMLTIVVAERRIARVFEASIVDRVTDPGARAAGRVAAETLLNDFLSATVWLAWLFLIVLVVALLTGPYRWSAWVRASTARLARLAGNAITGARARADDEATVAWVREHLGDLQLAGIALAVFLLFFLNVGWIGFLVLAGLVGAYELALTRFVKEPPSPGDERPAGSP
ncbi:MAG: hypothetical protein WEA10_03450 [Actinomycetota bacterium]